MFALKIAFILAFVLTAIFGFMFLKTFNKALNREAALTNENEGSLTLNKSQFVLIWVLALKLFGMMGVIL